jgi:exonuclease III
MDTALNKSIIIIIIIGYRPQAASRKDDDILKLKEIFLDRYTKLGYDSKQLPSERILCGPDNKICQPTEIDEI